MEVKVGEVADYAFKTLKVCEALSKAPSSEALSLNANRRLGEG